MTEIEARCERQSRETAEALEQGSCFRPYERGTDMAVHNHLHQIEAVMRQYGGELWQTFEGNPGAWPARRLLLLSQRKEQLRLRQQNLCRDGH